MSLKILQVALFNVTLDNKADLEKDGKCEVNFSRPFIKISGTPPGAKPLKISPLCNVNVLHYSLFFDILGTICSDYNGDLVMFAIPVRVP